MLCSSFAYSISHQSERFNAENGAKKKSLKRAPTVLHIDTGSPRTSKWCELLKASASGSPIHQKVSQSQPESGQKSADLKRYRSLQRNPWRG